jgi:phosphosulfolactate synthase (CoM biosynthesis protein A)
LDKAPENWDWDKFGWGTKSEVRMKEEVNRKVHKIKEGIKLFFLTKIGQFFN